MSVKAAIAPKATRAARATRVLRLAIAARVAKADIGDMRLSKISVKFKTNNVDDSVCCKLFIFNRKIVPYYKYVSYQSQTGPKTENPF